MSIPTEDIAEAMVEVTAVFQTRKCSHETADIVLLLTLFLSRKGYLPHGVEAMQKYLDAASSALAEVIDRHDEAEHTAKKGRTH